MKTIYIIIILFPISLFVANAQTANEVLSYSQQFQVVENHAHHSIEFVDGNEIEQVLSLLFIGYKKFLSSQDSESCIFTPSCSVYALESIKNQGIFLGSLNALDRLSRCNPFNYSAYKIDSKTNRLSDPVKK